MKADWRFWTLIALLAVLHFVLHLSFGLGRLAPDLLTLAVLMAARRVPGGSAAGLGFVAGLLEDAVSIGAFGAAAVTQTVVGYLGARSRDLFVGDSILFLGLYFFLGGWIQDALYYWVAEAVRRGTPVDRLLVQAPLEAAYLAATGIVVLVVFRSVRR